MNDQFNTCLKFQVRGLFYITGYDGTVFRYRLKAPFRQVFWFFGLASKVHRPLNVMLGIKIYKLPGFRIVRLYEDKFFIGQTAPNPSTMPLIILFQSKKGVSRKLLHAVEENIIATCEGKNVGLRYLDPYLVRQFYSESTKYRVNLKLRLSK